jgi:calcineurin-like phosphoesterase family protein
MIWFTSDTHFGHENIIKYANRPFTSCGQMEEVIINNINSFVDENDHLYHLGDFCFHSNGRKWENEVRKILNKLKCKNVHLVCGNHDPSAEYAKNRTTDFKSISDYQEISLKGLFGSLSDNRRIAKVIAFHYPIESWCKQNYNSIHLHGHTHGQLISANPLHKYRYDVGVDANNYMPISISQIMDKIGYEQ